MKKTVVCFVMDSHWSGNLGGAELQVKYLIEELSNRKDVEIHYVCRRAQEGIVHAEILHVIPHYPLISKYTHLVDYLSVTRYLRRIRPDVIYTRVELPYVGFAAKYCLSANCKSIWHIAHERDVSTYRIDTRRKLLKLIDRKVFEYGVKCADIIVGQAAYQNELLGKTFHRHCNTIIPNFHPLPGISGNKKSEGQTVFVWVANMKKWKRPEIFLDVAKRYGNVSNARFLMIGAIQDKYYEPIIKRASEQLQNFDYLGLRSLEETNCLIQGADVLVCTSHTEGFPNTFIQAWLRETLVVSLGIDPDALLSKEKLGVVVQTVSDLTATIGNILNGELRYADQVEKAKIYAESQHSLKNASKVIDLMITPG